MKERQEQKLEDDAAETDPDGRRGSTGGFAIAPLLRRYRRALWRRVTGSERSPMRYL
jgi:hypothetical protein